LINRRISASSPRAVERRTPVTKTIQVSVVCAGVKVRVVPGIFTKAALVVDCSVSCSTL
jgi:hypothetical protein